MNNQPIENPHPFLQRYIQAIYKWDLLQGGISILGSLLLLFSFLFFISSKDGLAAASLALSFISFFIFYSLSFTIKELFLLKALECKKEIEPLYDLEKKESLFACVEQYYLLASQARKYAFHYDSDSDTWSFQAFCSRWDRFFFWKEYHLLEEVALLAAIDLLSRQVRSTPCDVSLHSQLANTFILLQNHFLEPIKAKELMKSPSILLTHAKKERLQEKAKQAATMAVEELEIMSSYAPDEIWVHEQLAISYRELHMQEKEIKECEKLFSLLPDDPQVLLRLGSLYFKTGQNGKGLQMYETLKEIDAPLGQELIACYGLDIPFLQPE